MWQANQGWVRWFTVLILVTALVGVLAWWQFRGDKPVPPEAGYETIDLEVGPSGVVTLYPLSSAPGERDTSKNPVQVQAFFMRVYDERMRLVPPEERHKGPPVRVLILADEQAKPADVEAVRSSCEKAGFRDIEVRVRER
jgi:hypothetical protein